MHALSRKHMILELTKLKIGSLTPQWWIAIHCKCSMFCNNNGDPPRNHRSLHNHYSAALLVAIAWTPCELTERLYMSKHATEIRKSVLSPEHMKVSLNKAKRRCFIQWVSTHWKSPLCVVSMITAIGKGLRMHDSPSPDIAWTLCDYQHVSNFNNFLTQVTQVPTNVMWGKHLRLVLHKTEKNCDTRVCCVGVHWRSSAFSILRTDPSFQKAEQKKKNGHWQT